MAFILETNRLLLRTWTLEDAEAAFQIWGDAEVMQFVGKPFESVDVAHRALQNAIAAQEKYGFCLWATVEKSTRKVVGCCGFHPFEDNSALELAYHFVQEVWRRGYATEAAEACLRYGIENLTASKVVAFVHPENLASYRVLEKAGMTYIGIVENDGIKEKQYELKLQGEA